jgi:UDP-glucose 4-epimerase
VIALVTGGAGFIGSELVRLLEQAGARVRVLDNFATGRRSHLAGSGAEIAEGDVRDVAAVNSAMQGVECVFHLACVGVRRSIHAPREAHEVNARGTLNVLEAARAEGVARFIHVSSSEVYGTALNPSIAEDHPCFPATPYGASKLAGEAYARAWYTTYGLPVVIVRPFNAFGPRCHHEGDSGEVIPKFLLRAWAGNPVVIFGDGLQTRDFTYVADIASGIRKAAECQAAVGETFNLGSGREISILDLARLVGAQQVVHEAARPGDVRRLACDFSHARELLGFRPEVTLEQGLVGLRAWYERQGIPPDVLLREELIYNWRPNAGTVDQAMAG